MAKAKKPAKKKSGGIKGLARKLSNAEYAGAIERTFITRRLNSRQYEEYIPQRQESLAKQIGSDQLASQITQNTIGGLKGEAMEEFKRAAAASEATRQLRNQTKSGINSNALSNYEAEMRARGLDPALTEQMKSNFQTQQGFSDDLDNINRDYATGTQQRAGSVYDTLKMQAAMRGNSAESNARAQAQEDFTEKYNSYTTTRDELNGQLAELKKNRGSSYLNTYLTLKKEAEQRKAEMAQSQLEAAVSMGKQASADYFRQADLDLKTSKAASENSRANAKLDLDKQKFLDSVQRGVDRKTIDWAKVYLDAKKKGIELPPEFASQALAAHKKKRKYTYYDPRSGTTSSSYS
jgi:hypothetical protein